MCDVSDWDPQDEEIEFITNSAVTKGVIGSQEEVYKFDCSKDRAFALAGIALKNRCCVDVARVPSNQVDLKRTKGGKPFLSTQRPPDDQCPNFNFNISHDGRLVVLAAEPALVCGVDVCGAFALRRKGKKMNSWAAIREKMERQRVMTAAEWHRIDNSDSPELTFQKHFSVKEAYTKAVGVGLALDPALIEIQQIRGIDVTFCVNGEVADGCKCTVEEVPFNSDPHVVAVALVHPSKIVDSDGGFSATLQQPEFMLGAEEMSMAPAWVVFDPHELMLDIIEFHKRDEYHGMLDRGLW